MAMEVQVATKSDIPAIMLVERVEGYARLVGRWDAEQHAVEIENPSSRYLLARDGAADVAGFAILQGVGSANQCLLLKRIAVRNAGRGIGSRRGRFECCDHGEELGFGATLCRTRRGSVTES